MACERSQHLQGGDHLGKGKDENACKNYRALIVLLEAELTLESGSHTPN